MGVIVYHRNVTFQNYCWSIYSKTLHLVPLLYVSHY